MTRRQKTRISYVIRDSYDSLQHRQGINTLAIDHESGLLYSGGRDTMVKKWDLNADQELNLRRNTVKDRNGSHQSSDKESLNKGKSESNQIQPLDTFDWHSDWVNDISIMKQSGHGRGILISVLTCSNDRTILHWNPDNEERPALIGFHGDYIKRLAHPKGLNWVASGGLDRILNLWDINEQRGHPTRGSFELIVLKNTESSSGAIYSLGCDKNGSILVTGSLDKLVRIWDPKLPSDSSQIMRLQSHSDLVRDLIVSDDGRWVISCSSDATIKLWSLAMPNHCVATFSNNSDASVWCLASESPTLETFWAGTRDGWVYKIKKTVVADEYFSDCVGLCKQDTPILKIATMEDECLWTASTDSDIKRWTDYPVSDVPPKSRWQSEYLDEDLVPSLQIKMDSLNLKKEGQSDSQLMQPANRSPESCIKGVAGIKKATLLNDKKTVITQDIYDNTTLWDIITCKKVKDLGNVDYEKAIQTHNPAQWVANWCTIDTKSGDITVHIDEGKCLEAEIYFQDVKPSSVTILNNEDQRSILILT